MTSAAGRALTFCVLALGAVAPGFGATAELTAARDNTLYEDSNGSLSNGAGSFFFVGNTAQTDPSSNSRRALVRFDVGVAVPPGSTVTSVTMTLYLSKTPAATPRNISLHRTLADWGESTSADTQGEGSGAPAADGDATWIHAFFDHHFWLAPGGDFTAAASATTAVGGAGVSYTWSSAAMRNDVQAWVDAPATNFGWLLRGDESTLRTSKRFSSREDTDSGGARRPKLVITFTPPAGAGGCCFGSGACALREAGPCAAQGGVFQGAGTTCAAGSCSQPTGACCLADGSCQRLSATQCGAAAGFYHGNDTSCATVNCAALEGACCLPGNPGSCQPRTSAQCTAAAGSFLGGATACGVALCPFVDELVKPPVAQPVVGSAGGTASYELAMTEEQLQLHRDLPPTTLWTYDGSFPGPTIEASSNAPVQVTWINDLRDQSGALRSKHLLPVDRCMHGPHIAGDTARTVVHLHGGHMPADSDGHPEDTLLPGERDLYSYPNRQLPTTLWYHDHALGITRLNVYLGLSGFYLIRDPFEVSLGLPDGDHEVPLMIQDRSFNADGSLVYPAAWDEHFFGNRILVNGKVWPYLEVPRGKVRFRVLNAANARTLRLALSDGATFHQIGSDGGLLEAPVALTQVTLMPAERADLIIDFGGYQAGAAVRLVNDAPAPFPGTPGVGVVADVLEFRVQSQLGHTSPLPATLRPIERLQPAAAVRNRTFELRKFPEACAGSRWMINQKEWDEITEWPVLGSTEIWSFVNRSNMVHPMHLHLAMFQVLDRQPFTVAGDQIVPVGTRTAPPPNEAGWKDTVAVYPFEITRVIARFEDYAGLYAYHCHILEHEDHEMMRQFQTVHNAADACVPDDDTLCLDDQPGDRRFKVEIEFATSRSGGLSGHGHAISLADKGVTSGGLFWFFAANNPELLIKVINGCVLSNTYWVFFSAGTNVGISLTVTDTVTGRQFVRTNPDNTPVPTVQATTTSGLSCTP